VTISRGTRAHATHKALHQVRSWLVRSGALVSAEGAVEMFGIIERALRVGPGTPLLSVDSKGRLRPIETHLCECGCGQPTTIIQKSSARKGEVRGHARRFVKYHQQRVVLRRGYTVDPVTGCWIYNGKPGGGGYPRTMWSTERKRDIPAHRWYYEQAKGPIPDGLQLDHLCRTRMCVNPDHLEPVTCAENIRRKPTIKLTVSRVQAIRRLARDGATPKELAAQFGVHPTTIRDVIRGRYWNGIEAA